MYKIYSEKEDPKTRVVGKRGANDFYAFKGGKFQNGTNAYTQFNNLYFGLKEDLQKANEELNRIDRILVLFSEIDDPEQRKKELNYTRQEEIDNLIEDSEYDLSLVAGRQTPEAYSKKLEDVKNQIAQDLAPVHDLYEALTKEKDINVISSLMINAQEDISSATIKTYGRPEGFQQTQTPEPIVSETPITPATTPVSAEDDPIFGVSGISNVPPPDPADDPIFGDFGAQADTVTVQKQIEKLPDNDSPDPPGGGGSTAADIIAQREADRDEIYSLLQEQFGGASYFFRDQALNMVLGVTADGTIVSYDDESRERTIPLMQYIVDNGITSMTRVKGLLQKTKWWQTTDVARRTYDVMWGEMSDPQRQEFLEPTTDALTKEAQFLGFDLSEEDAFSLAQTLAQNGDSEDTEAIREMIIGQLANYEITNEFSDFSAGRDALEQLAYKYYVPQTEEAAQDWAELIYTGEATQTEYEQMLKATAVSKFPTLDKVINQMGITPDQYFSPYKYQIEQMLGRQVDMLDEFSDVIEYIPDAGTNARPMTLSEVRNFVRALPEWQQTGDAKDQARALSFSIGQTFGEVA